MTRPTAPPADSRAERRRNGLALARRHLGNITLVKGVRTGNLFYIRVKAHLAGSRLAYHRKGALEGSIVYLTPESIAHIADTGLQFAIRKAFVIRAQAVYRSREPQNLPQHRPAALELTVKPQEERVQSRRDFLDVLQGSQPVIVGKIHRSKITNYIR